jgi:hypothetical protein
MQYPVGRQAAVEERVMRNVNANISFVVVVMGLVAGIGATSLVTAQQKATGGTLTAAD